MQIRVWRPLFLDWPQGVHLRVLPPAARVAAAEDNHNTQRLRGAALRAVALLQVLGRIVVVFEVLLYSCGYIDLIGRIAVVFEVLLYSCGYIDLMGRIAVVLKYFFISCGYLDLIGRIAVAFEVFLCFVWLHI